MLALTLVLATARVVNAEGNCPGPFVRMATFAGDVIDRNENLTICVSWHEAGPHGLQTVEIDDH